MKYKHKQADRRTGGPTVKSTDTKTHTHIHSHTPLAAVCCCCLCYCFAVAVAVYAFACWLVRIAGCLLAGCWSSVVGISPAYKLLSFAAVCDVGCWCFSMLVRLCDLLLNSPIRCMCCPGYLSALPRACSMKRRQRSDGWSQTVHPDGDATWMAEWKAMPVQSRRLPSGEACTMPDWALAKKQGCSAGCALGASSGVSPCDLLGLCCGFAAGLADTRSPIVVSASRLCNASGSEQHSSNDFMRPAGIMPAGKIARNFANVMVFSVSSVSSSASNVAACWLMFKLAKSCFNLGSRR